MLKSHILFSNYDDLLNVADITKLLRISRQRVYYLIENGLIKAIKPGKAYLIPKTCLINYIENNEVLQHLEIR